MRLASVLSIVSMVTLVTFCRGKTSMDTYELAVVDKQSKSLILKEEGRLGVAPLSWRCEVDTLEETEVVDECDEWAYDKDEFYIVHGGACQVIRDDPASRTTSLDLMICQYGSWTGAETDLGQLHYRYRRGWFSVVTGIVSGITKIFNPVATIYKTGCGFGWWCKKQSTQTTQIIVKTPPKFTTCRPSDLEEEYFTPSGQESVTVTWTPPTATDDDGKVESIQQMFGNPRGGSFEGSSDTGGKQHTIIYEAKDNDGQIATCYFAFKVRVRTCGALPWPANGIRNCPSGQILGSECTYSCNRGYQLSGPGAVTCQGGDNPMWSGAPTCEEISCGSPPNITDGDVTCAGTTYGSFCTMSCKTGFDLDGQVFTLCQHDGTWFSGHPTTCTDDIAPEITCKSPQTFYADRGMTSMSVTWEEPTATDNLDSNPVVGQISGPSQGVTIDVDGSQYVTYQATDADGNTSPPCAIELRAESTSCGHPLDTLSDARLRFNCSMKTYTFGDTCILACSLNFPLEGPDVITCERNSTGSGEPVGYWSLENDTMPYCREIACNELGAPRDGGLVSDTIMGSPVRTMFCNAGKDIPDMGSNFAGQFICHDDGGWSPNMTKAPDCSETISPRRYYLPSRFYYYNGTCNESDTDAILDNYQFIVASLHNTLTALCPTSTSCTVNSPVVICGHVSRKKRSEMDTSNVRHVRAGQTHKMTKRETRTTVLTFKFNIQTDFDSSGMTTTEREAYVDGIQLNTLKPAILENARNGIYDHADYGVLTEDAINTDEWGTASCEPGSIKLRNDNCNLCPRGFYEANGMCTPCPVGTYSNISGSATCTSCQEGYSTRQDTSDSLDNCTKLCKAGSYSPDTFAPCAPCKAGYYQPLAAQTSCVACPSGKSSKTPGSTASSVCQYFDAYVVDTEGQTIDADVALLNEFTLSFYVKAVSASPNMVISVGQELEVIITDYIKIATTSTNDVIGQSSPDIWIHVAVSWDTYLGLLSAFYQNELVARPSSIFPTTSPIVQNGQLSINATGNAGVSISGLRLQGSVIDQVNNATVCQTIADDDIVNMDMFKNKTAHGVTLVVPSVCDVTDACLSSPCGSHGSCKDTIGNFTCTCFGGWSGVTCNTPPDFCIDNDCNNNATCVSGTEDYSCDCQLGYSGKFCQTIPVNGNWSSWSTWTECTATCNKGTRERMRACDSPAPGPHGQNCTGDVTETEICNTEPCPECGEPKRGFGSQLQCDTNHVTGMQTCIPDCRAGYVRPPGLAKENDTYTCGQETDYKWVPKKNIPGCVAPGSARRYTVSTTARYATAVRPEDEQAVVNDIKTNLANITCSQSVTCEVGVAIKNQDSTRRRRSTGSTVTLTFSIPLNGTSDLQLDSYMYNGTVSAGLQEVIDALTNLDSTVTAVNDSASSFFDVTANGMTYTVDANTLTFDGSSSCSTGQIETEGLCAECPAGSYQDGDYCLLCNKGAYQDQTGQSSCAQCPSGFTTETIGSDASTDCSVPDNMTSTTTSKTTAGTTTESDTTVEGKTTSSSTAESTTVPATTVTTEAPTTSTDSATSTVKATTVVPTTSTDSATSTVNATTVAPTASPTTASPQNNPKDLMYVYICVAVGAVSICITVITVTCLCLKKNKMDRTRVGDSSTSLRARTNPLYDHPPPAYPGKVEPHNIKFNRSATILTVRAVELDIEPGSKDV